MAQRIAAVLGALILVFWDISVGAWGPVAHRAVARLAQQRLTPAARTQVGALLPGESLADVAVWADDVRDTTHPHTAHWHFTNIPITSSGYRRERDCRPSPKGDCVVAAIERLQVELRTSTNQTARREALKFLVHFVGDIHQPLHTGQNNDRGGNDREIAMIGGSQNLHSAWDSGIIRASGRDEDDLVEAASRWLSTQNETLIAGTAALDWANEGFRLARDVAYPAVRGDNRITSSERTEAARIIEKRVARGGVRLAAVLNRAFAGGITE
jgi:hypothetical protein